MLVGSSGCLLWICVHQCRRAPSNLVTPCWQQAPHPVRFYPLRRHMGKRPYIRSCRAWLTCSRRERSLSPSIRKTEVSKFEKHSTERDEPS
jgi:hypothetical protein